VIDPPDQVKLQKRFVGRIPGVVGSAGAGPRGRIMRLTRTDRDHLRTLAICHYALGGLCFVFGCFPMIHLAIGIAIVTEAIPVQQGNGAPFPAELFGWFFIGVAALMIAFHWALAAALIVSGRSIDQRKRHALCLVVAGVACLFQPIGLVLGIFTFIVLSRPSVRAAFEPLREEPPEFDHYRSE
jgi:hypothetical protein